jgi:hypothetical protein
MSQQQQQQQQQQEDFVFQHPFTANVSGPTCSGKTYFVKMLLQHCKTKISPPPERIMWLYKRWQPLYDVIKTNVYPPVEFIQGIPLDLEQDSFIHPGTRNLVILDDLMSTAAKDSRINELFTEGSHHRNLSVIAINQNMYYNKDPTQRRNCHYLVLFNNPVDRQQVMTLARQMYPENPQYVLRHFKEATSKPYGYLLIDLKPTTPEHLRMRRDILLPLKSNKTVYISHYPKDPPSKQTYLQPSTTNQISEQAATSIPFKDASSNYTYLKVPSIDQQFASTEQTETNLLIGDMFSCDDCGLLFENMHDLQRHVKRWCPENFSLKRKRNEEDEEDQPNSKRFLIDLGEKEDEKETQEHKVFNYLMKRAKEHNEKQWDQKYDKYIKEGMCTKEARAKTEEKMTSKDVKRLSENYGLVILFILWLQNGPIHSEIMSDVKKFLSDGNDDDSSVKMALNKNRHLLEEGWYEEDSDSGEDDSDYEEANDDSEEDKDSNESDDEESS